MTTTRQLTDTLTDECQPDAATGAPRWRKADILRWIQDGTLKRHQVETLIRNSWADIVERSKVNGSPKLPTSKMQLCGSSEKTRKGEKAGIVTGVVYLLPATMSGRETCPNRTPACTAACLGHSAGRMILPSVREGQAWKTALRFGCRALYDALLMFEAIRLRKRAGRKGPGWIAAIRCDGSSDLGDGYRLAAQLAALGVQAYDYTKDPERARRAARDEPGKGMPEGAYRLAYSFVGDWHKAREVLRAGGTVAMVFATDDVSTLVGQQFEGYPIVNGDTTDARFLDPKRCIVALSWKGAARKMGDGGRWIVDRCDQGELVQGELIR